VALKFYFNESFPDSDENRTFIATLVRLLAARSPVVLLNTNLQLDDHREFWPAASDRIVVPQMSASRNLEEQSRIIARARAFIGTYGGLSYLAPFYGVPSLAFYSNRERFIDRHLELAQRVFAGSAFGHLTVLRTSELPLIGAAVESSLVPLGRSGSV
jgi:hypothetical protein